MVSRRAVLTAIGGSATAVLLSAHHRPGHPGKPSPSPSPSPTPTPTPTAGPGLYPTDQLAPDDDLYPKG
jgi:hypothetical protein